MEGSSGFSIGYGARQYGYDGWGTAALAPHSKWVSLIFIRGAALGDPDGLLEGTGMSVRRVKLGISRGVLSEERCDQEPPSGRSGPQ